ncbi:Uncharacterised protein [Vibrio cholerae]|nr:Uncharacterised protein [Vibrio cholerae]
MLANQGIKADLAELGSTMAWVYRLSRSSHPIARRPSRLKAP